MSDATRRCNFTCDAFVVMRLGTLTVCVRRAPEGNEEGVEWHAVEVGLNEPCSLHGEQLNLLSEVAASA